MTPHVDSDKAPVVAGTVPEGLVKPWPRLTKAAQQTAGATVMSAIGYLLYKRVLTPDPYWVAPEVESLVTQL